jgi:CBS domain containing-hemolysin-like protein
MVVLLVLTAVLLLLINIFFVLAEFAAVRLRGSRVEELVEQGHLAAPLVKRVHDHLDEYLSVVQVGITFASVALGFVGEPLAKELLLPVLRAVGIDSDAAAHVLATIFGIGFVSAVHILIGEQVPKLIAVRYADRVALATARPLVWCRGVFLPLLWILNGAAQAIIRWMGLPKPKSEELHSEDEIRIILDRSQEGGLISFRRLLFIENVFDLGELKVKDAMRARAGVRCLDARLPWAENEAIIRASRYSRFPLITDNPDKPAGVIHIKDLVYHRVDGRDPDLPRLMRPIHAAADTQPLEGLLGEMQRRRQQLALVFNAQGQWTGLISFEDIIEEIIGTITDEFETETPVCLGDIMTPGRVVLGVEGDAMPTAVREALARVPESELPLPRDQIVRAILERERLASTYLGRGIAMPHARLKDIDKPAVIFARSTTGIPQANQKERAHLLFILLTPAGAPRIHQRLQARIVGILENSEYVDDRLREATTQAEILDVVRTGEQAALD